MSTRDELIYTVGQAMGAAWTDETGYALAPRTVADHLLIQGWRPPMRVIEAVEELEALPEGSTILDVDDSTWQSAYAETGYDWTSRSMTFDSEYLVLMELGPFRVVWEPEGEA